MQFQHAYLAAYRSLKLTRDTDGVLVVEFHSKGGPFRFTAQDHTEFVDAFYRIAQDRENKIVILTGAGGEFIPEIDFSSFGNVADPGVWSQVHDEGVQLLENIVNIRVPVIAAIEGRAHVHSEYALLANVIVAGEGATFHDVPHFAGGIVPGDGIFTAWSYRAGAGRAEAFLLNPQQLTAQTAYEWGVIAEVVPNGKALHRARELAKLYLKAPEVTRRNTRVHFTQPLKERIVREVGYGLSLEGASAADLVKSMRAQNEPAAQKGKVVESTETSPSQVLETSQPEEFDLVILGGGTGSTIAAWTFAGEGKKVAVVERKYIGGSCPNIACLPSKNIIHSAKVASYFRRSKEFGITHDGFAINMAEVRERKRRMVRGLNDMYMENYRNTGAEFILGTGRFLAQRIVEVTLADGSTRQLRGANVIVSTGTRAALEMIPGLAEAQPLTHIEALELDEIPEHLLVVGGGYVGVEMSQAMGRFGSKVTMIGRNGRLMSKEDADVCEALQGLLADEGIDILLNARIKQVSGKSGDSVSVVVEQNGIEKVLTGSHVLVATGRKPNTEELGLELTGVELTDRGYIKVNERLQTTAPGVWAIGEVAGSPQFTHISIDDFRVVHANLTGGDRVTTGRQVPYCLFTDPELARIGLSETEAEAQGIAYRLFKVPMETNLRARTLSETRGFVKALVEADSDRILGFTAFGVGAGEIMATVQIAMITGLPFTGLRDAVLTHPTLVEGLMALFSSAASAHEAFATKGAQISAARHELQQQ